MGGPQKKKILIIEDEKPMAKALELKFTHAGFDAHAVHDGLSGITLLNKEPYALVLLDLVMPKMDGFKVLETLVREKNKTPIMVMSNLSQEDDEARARSLGAKEFFIKSNVSIATIVEQVKKFLA